MTPSNTQVSYTPVLFIFLLYIILPENYLTYYSHDDESLYFLQHDNKFPIAFVQLHYALLKCTNIVSFVNFFLGFQRK